MEDYGELLRVSTAAVLGAGDRLEGTCFAISPDLALTAFHVLVTIGRMSIGAHVSTRSASHAFREYAVERIASEADVALLRRVGRAAPHEQFIPLGYACRDDNEPERRFQTYGVAGTSQKLTPCYLSWNGRSGSGQLDEQMLSFEQSAVSGGYSGAAIMDRATGHAIGVVVKGDTVDDAGRGGTRVDVVPTARLVRELALNAAQLPPGLALLQYARTITGAASHIGRSQQRYAAERRFLVDHRAVDEPELARLVMSQPGTVWAVSGGTGSGKTELARQLIWRACKALEDERAPGRVIPVLIPLRDLPGVDFADDEPGLDALLGRLALSVAATGALPTSSRPRFLAWAEAMRAPLLVVFDGVDERTGSDRVPLEQFVQAFLRNPTMRDHHVLIGVARSSESVARLTGANVRTIAVQPLSNIQNYLARKRMAGDAVPSAVAQVVERLPAECRGRPLFLNLACELPTTTERSALSVTDLYGLFFRRMIERLRNECAFDEDEELFAGEALEELGYKAWWNGTSDREELLTHIAQALLPEWKTRLVPAKAKRIAERLVAYLHSLGTVISLSGRTVHWQHVSFQEYLSACALNRRGYDIQRLLQERPTTPRDVASFLLAMQTNEVRQAVIDKALTAKSSTSLREIVARAVAVGVSLDDRAEQLADLLMSDLERRFSGDEACNLLWTVYGGGLSTELERLVDLGGVYAASFVAARMKRESESWIVQRSYARTLARLRAFTSLSEIAGDITLQLRTRLWSISAMAAANAWVPVFRVTHRSTRLADPLQPVLLAAIRKRFGQRAVVRLLTRGDRSARLTEATKRSQSTSAEEIAGDLCEPRFSHTDESIVLWQCIRLAEEMRPELMDRVLRATDRTGTWHIVSRVLLAYEHDDLLEGLRGHEKLRELADAALASLGGSVRISDGEDDRLRFISWSSAGQRRSLVTAIQNDAAMASSSLCIAIDALAAMGAEKSLRHLVAHGPCDRVRAEASDRVGREWDIWACRMAHALEA